MDADAEVVLHAPPFVRIFKSGRVERLLGNEVLPAGLDPATGVVSKDVLIDPATNLVARLYLPDLAGSPPDRKLPVLVYYHGGGFVIETAFSPTYHNYLNSLVAAAGVVAVSVDYRRAPEHPLPAAYDDSWAALQWVASRPPAEEWLAERGDLGRVFLAGDSAGANIVHQVALRVAAEGLGGAAAIKGLLLIHPYFWGAEPLGSESRDPETRAGPEKIWTLVCPGTVGPDDPRLNPLAEGATSMAGLPCRRVLVMVAEEDILRERGRAYYEALERSGWEGEARLMEAEGEQHVFHIRDPKSAKAVSMMQTVVSFLTSD
ncbi:unnamed protein product [Musa hybrid cultivar]